MRKFTSIDLFAGVGGITLGFEQAGFSSKVAVENDPHCVEALKVNFPKLKVISGDIRDISGNEILKKAGLGVGEVDVVVGGPPCQGFSLIGLRDRNDPRSGLIFEFHRIVSEIQPKIFIMENVPGMLSASGGTFVEKLVELLEKDGYRIVKPIRILNAADYGVPQARRRVFIMGVRKDLDLNLAYPEITHVSPRPQPKASGTLAFDAALNLPTTPTVADAIADLPDVDAYEHLVESDETKYTMPPHSQYARIMRGYEPDPASMTKPPAGWPSEVCTGCRRTVHGEVLTKRFKETKNGETVPVSRLYKLSWDDVANTLRAGTPRERGAYSSPRPVHPSFPRVLTVREGARIQSFPDWHRFHITKWHGFRQVGNAVPPLLARAVALSVRKALSSEATSHKKKSQGKLKKVKSE